MGHILLNWGSYAHLNLQPVLYDQTTFILLIFFMFLTSISEMILSLWLSWLLFGVFGSSIYFISNQCPIISKHCCCSRPNCKRSKNGAVVNHIIGSSIIIDTNLITALLVWMDIYSHHLTVLSIKSGREIGHVLKTYLSAVGWVNF